MEDTSVLDDKAWCEKADTLARQLIAAGRPILERRNVPPLAQPLHFVLMRMVEDFDAGAASCLQAIHDRNPKGFQEGTLHLVAAKQRLDAAAGDAIAFARQEVRPATPLEAFLEFLAATQAPDAVAWGKLTYFSNPILKSAAVEALLLDAETKHLGELAQQKWGLDTPLAALSDQFELRHTLFVVPTVRADELHATVTAAELVLQLDLVEGKWVVNGDRLFAAVNSPTQARNKLEAVKESHRQLYELAQKVEAGEIVTEQEAEAAFASWSKTHMESVSRN